MAILTQTSPKSRNVSLALRRRIAEGKFGPGERIPNQLVLVEEFGVSQQTIQRAINDLVKDGFLRATRKAGTFVSESLPHQSNVALVIGAGDNLFDRAIRRAAHQAAEERNLHILEYRTNENPADFDWPKLCEDVLRPLVASIIFGVRPHHLEATLAMTAPRIPRAFISPEADFGYPSVYPEWDSFSTKAVDFLIKKGRRRIAHLFIDSPHAQPQKVKEFLHSLGNEVRPFWLQYINETVLTNYRSAVQVAHVLMQLEGDKRPDAIVVHDDHLVEPVVSGLLESGVSVPSEVELVAQVNFPLPVSAPFPMTRIGFDWVAVMRACLDRIEEQQAGKQPFPMLAGFDAVFESELSAAPTRGSV